MTDARNQGAVYGRLGTLVKLAPWERACIPALVSIVPKMLASYLSFDGFCDRLRHERGAFIAGMSEDLLFAAFTAWQTKAYQEGFAVKGRGPR